MSNVTILAISVKSSPPLRTSKSVEFGPRFANLNGVMASGFRFLIVIAMLSLSLNIDGWAGPKRSPPKVAQAACRDDLGHLDDFLDGNLVVEIPDIPQFQKMIIESFVTEFGFRPKFEYDSMGIYLYLLSPREVEIAQMGHSISGDGMTLDFGITEIFLPNHRMKRLSELLLSEILRRNPKIKFVHTSFDPRSTNRKVYDEKIKEGYSKEDALAQTPSAKRLARFGFVLGPKRKQNFREGTFNYVKASMNSDAPVKRLVK